MSTIKALWARMVLWAIGPAIALDRRDRSMGPVPATYFDVEWLNRVQAEMLGVLNKASTPRRGEEALTTIKKLWARIVLCAVRPALDLDRDERAVTLRVGSENVRLTYARARQKEGQGLFGVFFGNRQG